MAQVWSVCPIDSSSSLREENAIVCCSMLGGLTASKCLCDEVGHAEPDMLRFITSWQQVCSTESLSKVTRSAFLVICSVCLYSCCASSDDEAWGLPANAECASLPLGSKSAALRASQK